MLAGSQEAQKVMLQRRENWEATQANLTEQDAACLGQQFLQSESQYICHSSYQYRNSFHTERFVMEQTDTMCSLM